MKADSQVSIVIPNYNGMAFMEACLTSVLADAPEAELIVVGLPLNMDGTEGERAEKSRKLGKTLQIWSGLPVRMWDERQSTCEAADILDEVGTFGAHRKAILDSVSATVILEDYLAWRKEHPGEM